MGNACPWGCFFFIGGGNGGVNQKSGLLLSEKEFCRHCGAILSAGTHRVVRYCSQCGSSVRGSSVAPPEVIEKVRRETAENDRPSPPPRPQSDKSVTQAPSHQPQQNSRSEIISKPPAPKPKPAPQIHLPQPKPQPSISKYPPPQLPFPSKINDQSKQRARQTLDPSFTTSEARAKKKQDKQAQHKTTPPNSSRDQPLPDFLSGKVSELLLCICADLHTVKDYDGYTIVITK